MIITYPSYYKKFKCVAGECTDTCCVGWQVVIDSETAKIYENLQGELGDKIREKMIIDEGKDRIFVNEKGRCPFLNQQNLCDIVINAGENYLCHTCTMFPRFYETFGGSREMGLSLSCPVANQLVLNDKDFSFKQDFTDEDPEFNDLDAGKYLCLKGERDKLLAFAKSQISMDKKLKGILEYSKSLKKLLKEEDYVGISQLKLNDNTTEELIIDNYIFNRLEYLTEKGKILLTGKKHYKDTYSVEYTNILLYYIYRYFLKSIYKCNTYQSLKFAVFSVKVISALENENNSLSEVSRIFSKETEHSEYNLNYILEYLA